MNTPLKKPKQSKRDDLPLDILRNHNVLENALWDSNSFVGIMLDYCEWSDEEYWKLEKAIRKTMQNKQRIFEAQMRCFVVRLIEIFFDFNASECKVHFESVNIDFSESHSFDDMDYRFERLKFLIMEIVGHKSIITQDCGYAPSNSKLLHKKENLVFNKNHTELKTAKYTIEGSSFSALHTYCFYTALDKYFNPKFTPIEEFYKRFCNAKYAVFLLLEFRVDSSQKRDFCKNIKKQLSINEEFVYKNAKMLLIRANMITEEIAKLYFTYIDRSHLFYMGFPYGDDYHIFDSIITKNNGVDSKKLHNLVKKHYGICATYEDSGDKQTLRLRFYWDKH